MKNVIIVISLILVAFLASSTEATSYSLIERSLPLVLGAALGGVLACTSIIVGVLSASSKATKQKAGKSDAFSNFIGSLVSKNFSYLLVFCGFLTLYAHSRLSNYH